MNKLERLLKLLAVLLDTERPLTAEELRGRIGGYPEAQASFRRTFERDKDDLRSLGIPIRVEPVRTVEPPIDGYRVDREEYAGADPGLEPDELAALHVASALVRLDSVGDEAFWKLGGVEGVDTDAEQVSAVATLSTEGSAGELHHAVTERRLATFMYGDVERVLEPARLSFARGHWYVAGFDRTRDADRVFRVDRIEGSVEVGPPDAFAAREARGPVLTRTWEIGDTTPVAATVLIDPEHAAWARAGLAAEDVLETTQDGALVVRLEVSNEDAFRDWVLGFGGGAEVLDPRELRRAIREWVEAIG